VEATSGWVERPDPISWHPFNAIGRAARPMEGSPCGAGSLTMSRRFAFWTTGPDVAISFALRKIEQRAEFADVDREPGTRPSCPKAD
jgi:hypothetical protein